MPDKTCPACGEWLPSWTIAAHTCRKPLAHSQGAVDEAISDAEAFYARRLTAFAHSSYDLQANAPSAAAIRAAWRELEERADESFRAIPFTPPL